MREEPVGLHHLGFQRRVVRRLELLKVVWVHLLHLELLKLLKLLELDEFAVLIRWNEGIRLTRVHQNRLRHGPATRSSLLRRNKSVSLSSLLLQE